MQLKLKRYQRDGGIISKTAIFCLDARVELTADELANIKRYKLNNQVLYNSQASQRALAGSERASDGSFGGNLKGLALATLAHMKLNISVDSLQRGQHIECKSLDELLGAEEAVIMGCKNLKGYLDTAATFDGREVVVGFDDTGDPIITAESEPKKQITMQPASAAPAAPPLPQPVENLPSPETLMAVPAAVSTPAVVYGAGPSATTADANIFQEWKAACNRNPQVLIISLVVIAGLTWFIFGGSLHWHLMYVVIAIAVTAGGALAFVKSG